MAKTINLADKIDSLPPPLKAIIGVAGEVAKRRVASLYLVGGVVRDLLLGRATLDIDLVTDCDAIGLAGEISAATDGKMTAHHRFGTAKIQYPGLSFDLATIRAEDYHHPGALPSVRPGTIRDDLFRRDFTVNAMAVRLMPTGYGELIDLYGGLDDLRQKLIRVLHDKSFCDDATRIWRALRYQKRLDFQIESGTLDLLERDISMLDTVSGDRIRYELECVFGEPEPEKVLREADRLGVLQKLHPGLSADQKMAPAFHRAREASQPDQPGFALYLALLADNLSDLETDRLAGYLHLPKSAAKTLQDATLLKSRLAELEKTAVKPSVVSRLLSGYAPTALLANTLSAPATAKQQIERYLNRYRYVRPALNGNDLLALGVKPGPPVKETLARLRDARLDGEVTDKPGEIALVRRWLGIAPGSS
ncbi:MAG: CCA tRNA nucleotidyltransferase [Chloroflexota bacterium]